MQVIDFLFKDNESNVYVGIYVNKYEFMFVITLLQSLLIIVMDCELRGKKYHITCIRETGENSEISTDMNKNKQINA